MRSKFLAVVNMMILGTFFAVFAQDSSRKIDGSMGSFWVKFQSAVGRRDKAIVAAMTGFPLGMPYGVKDIRTKAQLLKSYNKIFDTETMKCFATAEPQTEEGKRKRFSINCGEAMMYWFEQQNGRYKFVAVDNVNE